MSGNISLFINDDCFAPSQWTREDCESWSNESTHSLDGDNDLSSPATSRDPSPQEQWQSPPMRFESPPMGQEQFSQCSEMFDFQMGLPMCDGDYTIEYQQLSASLPPLAIVSPASDYAVCASPLTAAPLSTPYMMSPPMTATTAGIEVAMPRPNKNYQLRLPERFAAGTPEAASPAPEMHLGAIVHVSSYASESPVMANAVAGPSTAACEPAPVAAQPVAKTVANRKRRADSAGSSDASLSPASRKKSRKVYDDALLAAATGPPGTKLYPKRLATPYQAFLDQLVLPVLKRISEPTKWLVVGGQRSPAFGKLLWERLDEDVKHAWFNKMNAMREEWNATAPENAQCPVQPKPKPETLPKIGKAYREVLGHIEPLVIAFFAGVERMNDLMPGGQPYIDQEAMARAAQGKADVLGFGEDAKGGPLKAGVKPPGTILVGPSTSTVPRTAGSKASNKPASQAKAAQPTRPIRPLPRSRQALAEDLVPVEAPARRSYRCGFTATGDADRHVGASA